MRMKMSVWAVSTTKSHPCSLISKPGPLLQPATLGQSKSCCSRIPGNADGQCLQSCQTTLGHHRELHQEGKVSNHRATFVWLTVGRFKHLSLNLQFQYKALSLWSCHFMEAATQPLSRTSVQTTNANMFSHWSVAHPFLILMPPKFWITDWNCLQLLRESSLTAVVLFLGSPAFMASNNL